MGEMNRPVTLDTWYKPHLLLGNTHTNSYQPSSSSSFYSTSLSPDKLTLKNTYMNLNPPSFSLSGHIIIGDHSFSFIHVHLKPLPPFSLFFFGQINIAKHSCTFKHVPTSPASLPLSSCLFLSGQINMGEQTPLSLSSFFLFASSLSGQINFGNHWDVHINPLRSPFYLFNVFISFYL